MAPVTRRSGQSGSGVNAPKIVHRKQRSTTRGGSQDTQNTQNTQTHAWSSHQASASPANNGYDSPSDDGQEPQMSIEGPQGVAAQQQARQAQSLLHPLRDLAEKVGNEVESFAVALDRFVSDLPARGDEADRFEAAQGLVGEFKAIADEAVRDLRKTHEREREMQLKMEWSQRAHIAASSTASKSLVFGQGSSLGASLFGRKAESVKALRQWEQEADIWELFRLVLEIHYRPRDEMWHEERQKELDAMDPPHRYTPESQLWERFLIEDEVAKERALIKRWLEETADHQESSMAGIVEELEAKSGAGKGLWAKGWVNTREKIKAEKRLRTWPSASESIQPQIRRSDNNDLLVTMLDPDAPERQQRTLEKPDEYFERAFWIACWEMLRRGKPWEEIKDWCEDHGQGWRAVIMGKSGDNADALSTAAWKKMCYLASQSGCSSEYEAAVYGFLGGSVKAVEKISRTLDDHLYAYYNGILLRQFEQYVQQTCPDRVSASSNGRALVDDALQDPEQAQQAITDLVVRLRDKPATQRESIQPMKIIQSYLLANETESLINTLGYAISDEDTRQTGEQEVVIFRLRDPKADGEVMPETEVALDSHGLRIASHIAIILASLRNGPLENADERDAEENVIVAYMQKLREAGKRDLLLLYASRMWRGRHILTLSRMLQDVTQASEQREMLQLMTHSYHMDVTMILGELLKWLLAPLSTQKPPERPIRILEKSQNHVHPGQRIRESFIPEEMTVKEVELVKTLEWFVLLEGQWDITFWALSYALRTCLVAGRIACALEIVQNYPFDTISKNKASQVIKRDLNVMEDNVSGLSEDDELFHQLDWMKRQSRTYYELQQLLAAIDSLAAWAEQEHPYVLRNPKPSAVPSDLKRAKAEVDEAMAPLLSGILQSTTNPEEAADLQTIRKMYLPELVIAYQTFQHTAGFIYTRDCLLESMDLSVTIAKEENGLAKCLTAAGRMRELVTGFAHSSQAILVLKAQNNKPWKTKKDREGRDPAIWEIGPQNTLTGDHANEAS